MKKDLPPPNTQRQELIDKGHIQPDPNRDGLAEKDWENQDKFLTKVKQSIRRTMDDFTGRTRTLEEKARPMDGGITETTSKQTRQNTGHSATQEKWRAEMEARREQKRDRNYERGQ